MNTKEKYVFPVGTIQIYANSSHFIKTGLSAINFKGESCHDKICYSVLGKKDTILP